MRLRYRFTNAYLLYERLNEILEWRHGHIYVPKGNKRLIFFVDDLNLAQVYRCLRKLDLN